jgi:hypothetical protein
VFGEPEKAMTSPSVTQRDYQAHPLTQSSPSHHHASTKTLAVASALAPDARASWKDAESCTTTTYRITPLSPNKQRSAGIPIGSREKVSNISSIPFGDEGHFRLSTFQTTTSDQFKEYPMEKVEHPILGAKITKSKVTFGETGGSHDVLDQERYTSTTHSAFVPHPESLASIGRGVSVKPRVTLNAGEDIEMEYSMGHNTTTHADHYKGVEGERVEGIKGKTVPKKNIFPMHLNQQGVFESITGGSYAMRNGLQFSVKDSVKKNQEKQVIRQFITKSSIAFGDPQLHYL